MLDLPGLSRPLRRHAHKTLGKKAKTHERRSRRLRRESSLLRSAGASSLQDGTMERLAHCYPGYRKCIMCVYPAFPLCPLWYLFCIQVNFTVVSLIFIFACLAGPFFLSVFLLLITKLQGFILGALANVHLTHQFGFGKVGIGADLKRFDI